MQTELLIDCRQFDTPDSLHRYLAEQLAFPVYYGSNWDALYDVLSTYSRPLTLYITQTAALIDTFGSIQAEIFFAVLRDAVRENPLLNIEYPV